MTKGFKKTAAQRRESYLRGLAQARRAYSSNVGKSPEQLYQEAKAQQRQKNIIRLAGKIGTVSYAGREGYKVTPTQPTIISKEIPAQTLTGKTEAAYAFTTEGGKNVIAPTGTLAEISAKVEERRKIEQQQKTLKGKAAAFGTGVITGLVETGRGTVEFGKALVTKPVQTIKSIPAGIKQTAEFYTSGKAFELAKAEPGYASGRLIGEALLFKGTGAAAIKGGKAVRVAATKVDPLGKSIVTETTKVGGKIGEEEFITVKGIGGTEKVGLIPGGKPAIATVAKESGILRPTLRGGFGYSLKEQKTIAGQLSSGAAASGFESFITGIKKSKIIEAGSEGYGLFATPAIKGTAYLRTSRLGATQPQASFADIIKGDFSLTRAKPQAFFFKEGKGFKGTGKPSGELETTAKPGQVVIKEKRVGAAVIEGERVPFYLARIGTASEKIAAAFKKAQTGKRLSIAESLALKATTGFKPSELSYASRTKPLLRPYGLASFLSPVKKKSTFSGTTTTSQLLTPPGFSFPYSPKPSRPGSLIPPTKPRGRGGGSGGTPDVFITTTPLPPSSPGGSPAVSIPPFRPRVTRPVIPSKLFRPPITRFKFSSRETEIVRKRKKGKGIGRVYRQPSLVALGEKIYSPSRARAEFSSLNIRPIIVGRRKRGKKKKR